MINTIHKNVHLKNQTNEKIPRSGVIDQEKINPHDLCYECSKYVPDFLSGKLRIINYRKEPHFLKIKLLSGQIKMNTLFKNTNERKIRRCDKNIHKAMKICVEIYQRIKQFFVTVQPKNACKMESVDHL